MAWLGSPTRTELSWNSVSAASVRGAETTDGRILWGGEKQVAMSKFDFDLLVIGGGSGGVGAARRAAEYGARVAVAEGDRLGGTCVHRGCIPKKLMVYASNFRQQFELAEGYGYSQIEYRFSWPLLVEKVQNELNRLGGFYEKSLQNAGVTHLQGWAKVTGTNSVEVDGKSYSTERILVAVGGFPFKPRIPGAEHTITSREAFHLPELPGRILMVGSGYIGVEFAGIFNGLGCQTHMMFGSTLLLPGFDQDIRSHLQETMEKAGVRFHTGTRIQKVEPVDGGYRVTAGETVVEVDKVFLATGRHPRTEGLGLEGVGVKLDSNGAVKVNGKFQTSVGSIYAIGDCIDRIQLTPVAIREGRFFAGTLYNNNPVNGDYRAVPTAVFSAPPVGTVGLTQEEALAQAPEGIDLYRAKFRPTKYTLPDKDYKVLLKLIVCRRTDRVLGVHVVGEEGPELSQILGVLVLNGATKADFDSTVAVHPTTAEELVLMRNPSETITP